MTRTGIYPVGSPATSLPLTSAVCHYQVTDVQVVASLVQTYVSNALTAQEVIYIFPLPQDAAVCSFKAIIDGKKTIKGIVKEKNEAKQDYDRAVAKGKTAALLEKQHADVFQVSLGNLKPKQTVDIHISWVSVIAHDGAKPDSLRLMIPIAIAPRYGPAPPISRPPKGAIAIPVKPNLQVTISVQMTGNITSITSPTHPIALTLGSATANAVETPDPSKAHISLETKGFLFKDVVVVLASQKLDQPRCTIETDAQNGTDAYALTLVPRFNLPPLECQEYIFLVDRSGSMDGQRIKAVRTALQIMLRSLPTKNTSFNIWSFGSTYSSLWPSSKIYSADSVAKATLHIDKLKADFGGTEIGNALQAVFESAKPQTDGAKDIPRVVFVLTDGEAWDLQGVIDHVRDATEKAKAENSLLRAFVLGVGDGVSTPMCKGIARAGKGIAVFVGNNEKPDGKLMGLLKAARGAVIEDLVVDWGTDDNKPETDDDEFEMVQREPLCTAEPRDSEPAAPINLFEETPSTTTDPPISLGPEKVVVKLGPPPRIQQAPSTDKLPIPLYPGFRCSIFAIVRRSKGHPGASRVTLTGQVLGRPVSLEVPVIRTTPSSLCEIDDNLFHIHVLAARSLIQAIEDLPKSDVNEATIIRLGTQYSLASSQTSFIAVEEQDDKVLGEAEKVIEQENYLPEEPAMRRANRQVGGGLPPSSRLNATAPTQTIGMNARFSRANPATMSAAPSGQSAVDRMKSKLNFSSLIRIPAGLSQPRPGARSRTLSNSPAPVLSPSPSAAARSQIMPFSARGRAEPVADSDEEDMAFGLDFCDSGPSMEEYSKQKTSSASPSSVNRYSKQKTSSPGPSIVKHSKGKGSSAAPLLGKLSERKNSSTGSTIESLARNQSFEGYFPPSALRTVLPTLPESPKNLKTLVGIEQGQQEKIWITLLVIAYLTKAYAEEADTWTFLAEKGLEWVRGVLTEVAGAEGLLAEWQIAAGKAL